MAESLIQNFNSTDQYIIFNLNFALFYLDNTFERKFLADAVAGQLATARFATTLASIFAALAVLLSAIGLYGVISYSVSRQTRDFGVRMALGAGRYTILALVMRQGLSIVTVGIGVGVAAALAASRVLASVLYGVAPADPATFVAVAALLVLVTGLACYIPARRATRVDPLRALRAG